jgi:uncharacterized protein (DUF433 family)
MSLTLPIRPIEVPLREDPPGVFRVGKSRVRLERVVQTFLHGARPEDIAENFPSLDVADIYAVLTYYLHNKEEVDQYIRQVDKRAAALRQEIEANQHPLPEDLKNRLAGARVRMEAQKGSQEGQGDVSAAG